MSENYNDGAIIEGRKLGSIMEKKYLRVFVFTECHRVLGSAQRVSGPETRTAAHTPYAAICFMKRSCQLDFAVHSRGNNTSELFTPPAIR